MKRALIFFGGWDGHEPQACAQLFQKILAARDWSVDAEASLAVLDDAARLRSYDVIVPLWTMGQITEAQEKNLVDAVESGVGLAGFHGGMGDAFRGRILYEWVVGGHFVSHPDNIRPYSVQIVKPSDPIMAGVPDFSVNTEQYYLLVDPGIEILATTTFGDSVSAPWTKGVVMPVVWKKRHGHGRVFYSALGHHAEDFQSVPQQLEITRRGIEWAAR